MIESMNGGGFLSVTDDVANLSKVHNNGIFPTIEIDLPLQLRKEDCMKSVKI